MESPASGPGLRGRAAARFTVPLKLMVCPVFQPCMAIADLSVLSKCKRHLYSISPVATVFPVCPKYENSQEPGIL